MKEISVIGLDLAKNVFHLVGLDQQGNRVIRKMLKRGQMLSYFARLPVCLIGIEACAGAHYWQRQLEQFGHRVRQLPAQVVKAHVRGNKNDYNDALAIAEVVTIPEVRAVALKTIEQQDLQALIRLREKAVRDQTASANQLRGLLAEYGVIVPKGLAALRRRIPEILEDGENELSPLFRELLAEGYEQLLQHGAHIKSYTHKLQRYAQQQAPVQRLQSIPGFGPIVSTVFFGEVGDGKAYRRGRDVAASIGLVPRQHSSGGKDRLLGISKRGNGYLRSLLVHGARAMLIRAEGKTDRLSQWVLRLQEKKGHNKAIVALANKMARIGWAILNNETTYQPA